MAADRLHVVVVDRKLRVVDAHVADPVDPAQVAANLAALGVVRVAIDSPDAPSVRHHAGDAELSTKFRGGRCGEVALGRTHRIWVSWVTPAEPPFARWMENGFALFAAVRATGADAVEVYPYAAFRILAGGRLPSKATPAGIASRVDVVTRAGLAGVSHLAMWSHDGLDAAAAAIVAADRDAVAVSCGHDGSAIWLPSGPVRTTGDSSTVAP